MNFKKFAKVLAALIALAAIGATVYYAVTKLFPKKEVQYFDDSDFFECDDDLCEVIECENEEKPEEAKAEEKPAEKPKKEDAKKKTAKKAAK